MSASSATRKSAQKLPKAPIYTHKRSGAGMDKVLHRLKFAAVACWALSIPCVQGQSIPLPHVSVGGPAQVAIYYDGPQTLQSEGVLDARQVQNLLGHFNLTGEVIPLGDYRTGQLAKY